MRHETLEELFSRRGAIKAVAEACKIRSPAVSQWEYVPKDRVDAVAAALGVDPKELPTRPERKALPEGVSAQVSV
jgi:hypothetical protein